MSVLKIKNQETGEWETIDVIRGPRGAQGEKGETGATGPQGPKGETGANGVSVTHSWDGTTLTLTSASGTSSVDLKGEKGERGETGATGPQGIQGQSGVDGKDYVLTSADKAEIAEQVEGATIVQPPKYVVTTAEMTDTDRVYVLIETGHIWANANTTVTKTITEEVDGEFPENSRLGSDGSVATDPGSYAGYTVTPFIDLQAYPIPFTLHLDGATFIPTTTDGYTRIVTYDSDKAKISVGNHTNTTIDSTLNVSDSNVTVDSNGNSSILFDKAITTNSGGVVQYVRFSGKIHSTPRVYVTYEGTVTGVQWFDTNTTYAPALTDAERTEIAEQTASLIDTQILNVIGDGTVTV